MASFLAYGQTGSGKTHTVSGIIRALSKDLFNISDTVIHLSFIQILGNNITDLLLDKDDDDDDDTGGVSVMEDKFGKINIVGAREIMISDSQEFLFNTEAALSRRNTSSTLKNDTSSRSHAVCRIRYQ